MKIRPGDAKTLDAMVHDGLTNAFTGKQMFVEATEIAGELRGFLDASVGYSPHLLYVLVADQAEPLVDHVARQREDGGSWARSRRAGEDRGAGLRSISRA